MEIKLLLIICGITEIFAKNISDEEYHHPNEETLDYWVKNLILKINQLSMANEEMSKNLIKINNKFNDLMNTLQTIPEQTENIKLLKLYSGWNVILRRQDGSENFYRDWEQYKNGFGNPNGEFFIGLDKLHQMTALAERQELLIILKDFNNQTRYARYDNFVVGNATEKYRLQELGQYSGDAGDALSWHKGYKFSTYDQANEEYDDINCAEKYKGAWWFGKCYNIYFSFYSHLNGPYLGGATLIEGGINWYYWHGLEYSLKFVEMAIRNKL